jgi:hypothetical protein
LPRASSDRGRALIAQFDQVFLACCRVSAAQPAIPEENVIAVQPFGVVVPRGASTSGPTSNLGQHATLFGLA